MYSVATPPAGSVELTVEGAVPDVTPGTTSTVGTLVAQGDDSDSDSL